MAKNNPIKAVAKWLSIIGGVNWGLVGLLPLLGMSSINLVTLLLGSGVAANVVYSLVGASAVWLAVEEFN